MLKVVKLEQNYRSTSRILQSANKPTGNNPHLFEKNLWSTLGEGDPIRIMPARTPEHEVEKVIGEILKARFRDRADFKDFAILYRGNHQSRLFEKALREKQYRLQNQRGHVIFLACRSQRHPRLPPPHQLLTTMLFSASSNTPAEIGTSTLEKLGEYAHERKTSLLTAAQELGFAQRVSAKATQRIETFCFWLHEITRVAENADPTTIVKQVINDIGYEDWLKNTCNTPNKPNPA